MAVAYQWPAPWPFILKHSTVMVFNISRKLKLMKPLEPSVLKREIGLGVRSMVSTGPICVNEIAVVGAVQLPLVFISNQINSLWSCFTQSYWKGQRQTREETCIITWVCLKLNQQPSRLSGDWPGFVEGFTWPSENKHLSVSSLCLYGWCVKSEAARINRLCNFFFRFPKAQTIIRAAKSK